MCSLAGMLPPSGSGLIMPRIGAHSPDPTRMVYGHNEVNNTLEAYPNPNPNPNPNPDPKYAIVS